jgi:hypothetical protein
MTKQLVEYFNSEPPAGNLLLKIDVAPSKVGMIDVKLLFDKKSGIKAFNGVSGLEELCRNEILCRNFVGESNAFAVRWGYSVILDSSKERPMELKALEFEDVTARFILEFNKKYR